MLFIIVSCSDKQEKIPALNFENKTEVLDAVARYYNKDAQVAVGGLFDETGKQFIAAGLEINNTDEWGIKFEFIEKSGNEFNLKYQTELLDGSFKESFFDKIKIFLGQKIVQNFKMVILC